MDKFVCTHCGRHFEGEAGPSLVCPECFWSTSLEKEEGRRFPANPGRETLPGPSKVRFGSGASLGGFWLWAGIVLAALAFLSIFLFASRHLLKQNEILKKIESKNAEVIATEAPELGLQETEREILNRRVTPDPPGEITESENEILARRVSFRPKGMRGLPSVPWNGKEFEEFLKAREAEYKVPLGRSYRKKLEKLFKAHALPAQEAFEAKDYLKARDEWIRSLAFPIYGQDVKKHRGVVLTLLRPYVNDVLSKIGAMNSLLMEKDFYSAEEKVEKAYDSFYTLLQNHSWDEARAALLEVMKEWDGIQKAPRSVSAPPLPPEAGSVDEGIRDVLLAQAAPMEPSVLDGETLRQDLEAKEEVIRSRSAEALARVRQSYDGAVVFLESQNWEEARKLLETVDFPENLAEDAKAKIRILERFEKQNPASGGSPSLDSGEKSG